MKRLTLNVLLSFVSLPLFALSTDGSGDAGKMKTLFQCGVGTESGFNGWKIDGLSHEANTYFEKDHIEFFQHSPGNYSIGFEKKIEEMIGYTDLQFSIDMKAIENCVVNYTTAYLSKDGKEWEALNSDPRNGVKSHSDKMEFLFVKFVADVTFFKEARFRFTRASIFGSFKAKKERPTINLADITYGPASNQVYEEFTVFSFDKKVNVETQNEKDYDFVLSNLLGQVVIREKSYGSRRFEVDVPDGIYFVTILQGDNIITTKKVVL